MKNLLLLITVLFGIHFCSYSQYEYSLELDSFIGKGTKDVLSEITRDISGHHRYINGETLTFQCEKLFSEEEMNQIVEIAGYTIKNIKIRILAEEKELKKD